jgi:hypothetical protein
LYTKVGAAAFLQRSRRGRLQHQVCRTACCALHQLLLTVSSGACSNQQVNSAVSQHRLSSAVHCLSHASLLFHFCRKTRRPLTGCLGTITKKTSCSGGSSHS